MMLPKTRLPGQIKSILLLLFLFMPGLTCAEDSVWPKEIQGKQGKVLIYLPQIETFEGDTLSGRAAVSLTINGKTEPVFGTIWIVSRVETDRDANTVTLKKVRIPRVHFTGSTPSQESQLSDLIEESVEGKDISIDLDRLLPLLKLAEKEAMASQNLSTDPPIIIYKEEPAVLISIDGPPQFKAIENSSLQRIVNTPFLIVTDSSKKRYYIYAAENGWYESESLKGAWRFTTSVPQEVAALAPDSPEAQPQESTEEKVDIIPTLVLVTEPSELIFTNGEAKFKALENTSIRYVTNTDSDILHYSDNQYYVLLSGRWFTAAGLNGPWEYIASEKLPEDFQKISDESDLAGIRYAIAGTDEASEAVLGSYIPQTAKVERSNVSIKVNYDGKPQFTKIPGTELSYAINSEQQVIKSGKKYYACVDAVWYTADNADGPWQVATVRPKGVEEIPPESPVYNVKYVYIYDVQPDVVYVGYLPGYTGTYIYSSTVFYGTGYYYSPWYHHYYYPRPATWSIGVRYSPWGGWRFGIGYSTGRFTFGIGFGSWSRWHGGYWGPGRYRGYNRGYNRGYHHGYRAGVKAGARRSSNIYRSQSRGGLHLTQNNVAVVNKNRATQRKNNMYADAKGTVHQRKANGSWQQQGRQSSQRATAQNNSTRQQNLNRAYQVRQQGSMRNQRSRPSGGGRRR